jgi:hypothetical protein
MKIKVINDMADGMTQLKQHKTTLVEYWNLAVQPGQPNLDVSVLFFIPTLHYSHSKGKTRKIFLLCLSLT